MRQLNRWARSHPWQWGVGWGVVGFVALLAAHFSMWKAAAGGLIWALITTWSIGRGPGRWSLNWRPYDGR